MDYGPILDQSTEEFAKLGKCGDILIYIPSKGNYNIDKK